MINPYVGCPNGCKYCYASFMKRFTGHSEEWGTFIDIKRCSNPISKKRLKGNTGDETSIMLYLILLILCGRKNS